MWGLQSRQEVCMDVLLRVVWMFISVISSSFAFCSIFPNIVRVRGMIFIIFIIFIMSF